MIIGIIGAGRVGLLYQEILTSSYDIETILCDTSGKYPIIDYKDVRLQNCEIIIIATPPINHYEIIEYYLAHTKLSIVVETPAVINENDLTKLQVLYKNNQERVYFAYHTFFNPLFKDSFSDQNINKIQVTNLENVIHYHGMSSWVFNPDISGGGCIIDSGINIFSVIARFVPDLKVKSCFIKTRISLVEDYCHIILESKSRNTTVDVVLDWNFKDTQERKYSFYTKNFINHIDLANGEPIIEFDSNIQRKNKIVDQDSEYKLMVMDFINYFTKNQESKINFDPLLPIRLVFDCYKLKQNR
jgi:predicted dehydrogenase